MDTSFYNSKFISEHKMKILESINELNFEDTLENKDDGIDQDLKLEALIDSLIETIQESIIIEEIDEAQLNENIAQTFRKAKDKVSKTLVKFTLAEKQMAERLNEKFNRFIKLHRESKRNATYDTVVKRTIDLSRMLKNLIRSFIIGLLIPGGIPVKIISTILAILVQTAIDKRTDAKYKNLIFNDLKFELRVVQEKIKDAEARGDIKAKYKLMRIENQIGRAMDRIQYNIKD